MKHFSQVTILAAALLAAAVSCTPATPEKPEEKKVEVSGISLSENSITITVNEEKTLTATVTPSDATDKTVTWSSDNAAVASVADGKVKGISAGKATITATAGSKSATCSVTVAEPVLVVTGEASGISWNSATLALVVNINLAGKYNTYEAGIVYGRSQNLSLATDTIINIPTDKDGKPDLSGTYGFSLVNLEQETTYFYRGFAKFDGKENLGDVKSFKTGSLNIATEQKVDLGLPSGIKWAGWNIGATKPEETGYYLSWGETEPKTSYEQSEYKFGLINKYGEKEVLYKYNTDSKYGNVDNLTRLLAPDDAAYVNWGSDWRMPTDVEKKELLENTTHTKMEYKGVKGWVFTSKINGVSIFLPAAGEVTQTGSAYVGEETAYWTASLMQRDPRFSYIACNWIADSALLHEAGFEMDSMASSYNLNTYRYYGLPVRAVTGSPIPAEKYVLTTSEASEITPMSAKVTVTMSPAASTTEYGVLYSSSQTDPLVPAKTAKSAADANGTVILTGLLSDVKYYACSYAIVDGVTYYGNRITFNTKVMDLLGVADPTDISDTGATLNASVGDISLLKTHYPALECGIAYQEKYGSNYDNAIAPGAIKVPLTPDASGKMSAIVTGLTKMKAYLYRSYLKMGDTYVYSSDVRVFQTKDIVLPQWVDLGLSVLWASWDVGATAADQYGSYYAWAETTAKDPANPAKWEASAYKWYDASTDPLTILKYYPGEANHYKGVPDGLNTVQPADDAATQEWGGGARMPSNAEFEELLAHTTRTTEYYNGKQLIKFTAANGNYIYFQYFSAWWSSSIYSEIVYANNLFTKGLNSVKMQYSRREYGSSLTSEPGCHIRPVKAK